MEVADEGSVLARVGDEYVRHGTPALRVGSAWVSYSGPPKYSVAGTSRNEVLLFIFRRIGPPGATNGAMVVNRKASACRRNCGKPSLSLFRYRREHGKSARGNTLAEPFPWTVIQGVIRLLR